MAHALTGRSQTSEHIERRTIKLRGRKRSVAFRLDCTRRNLERSAKLSELGLAHWNSGRIRSEETRARIGAAGRGRQYGPEYKEKMRQIAKVKGYGKWMKGRKGPLSTNWQGGRTDANKIARTSVEFIEWRRRVFERDDYRCQGCGERGGKLHAHHDMPFSIFIEQRFEVLNGVTLCEDCHEKIPRNREKLEEIWMTNQY